MPAGTDDAWARLGEAARELFRDPRADGIQEAQRVLVRAMVEQFPELSVRQIVDLLAGCEKHGWQLVPKVCVRGIRLEDDVIRSVLPGWRFPKVWEMDDGWDSREWARRAARGELGEAPPAPERKVEPLELSEDEVRDELATDGSDEIEEGAEAPPRRSWWCRLGLHKIDVCSGVGPCKRPGCEYVRTDRVMRHGWVRHTEPPQHREGKYGAKGMRANPGPEHPVPPPPPAPGPPSPPRPPEHRPVS